MHLCELWATGLVGSGAGLGGGGVGASGGSSGDICGEDGLEQEGIRVGDD